VTWHNISWEGGGPNQTLDGNGESQRVEQREGGGGIGTTAELSRRNAHPHVQKGLTQKKKEKKRPS
jgi:hypothetical protein